MLKVLFIGDINGRIGRRAVARIVPKLKKKHDLDLVIANAENAAHGSGITERTIKELMKYGIDFFTTGDHAFKRNGKYEEYTNPKLPVLRPANMPPTAPGNGYKLLAVGSFNILLINLIGRVYMSHNYDCPFREIDNIFANFAKQNISAIIVDIHAEATSEKAAIKHYLDGKVSAVLGTHTHIMTADEEITKKGTAFITDVGMVGAADSCLGIDKKNIIKGFLTQIKQNHIIPEKGRAIFNSVILKIDPKTTSASSIKPIKEYININN